IDRAAGRLLLALIVAGEIGADGNPMYAAIGRLEQSLSRLIQRIWIVGRKENWSSPLEPVIQLGRASAIAQVRHHTDIFAFSGPFIKARDLPLIASCVNNVRVRRIWGDVAGFAASHVIPIGAAY